MKHINPNIQNSKPQLEIEVITVLQLLPKAKADSFHRTCAMKTSLFSYELLCDTV